MKLQVSIPGTFKRTPLGDASTRLSLADLMPQIVATAQANFDGWTARLARDYGLDLVLEPTLKRMVGATVRTQDGEAPFLSVATGRVRRDRPLSAVKDESSGTFLYEFCPASALLPGGHLLLSPADGRLPKSWPITGQVPGGLLLTLEDGRCLENPELAVDQVWDSSIAQHQRLTVGEHLDALDRLTAGDTALRFNLGRSATLLVDRKDVPEVVKAAWALVEANEPAAFDAALMEARARQDWTQDCEAWLAKRARVRRRPDWLEAMGIKTLQFLPVVDNPARAQALQPLLAQGEAERHLRDIIVGARKFLFVASYVIEDLTLANLIAAQAEKMPGRVWVLCNLKETFLENLPALLGEAPAAAGLPETDRRKLDCLRVLLASPALVRHSNIHLKAYASELKGYLGSANLARMSLRRNWESGGLLDDTEQLRALLKALRNEWKYAESRVAWPEVGEGLVLETLKKQRGGPPLPQEPFLSTTQYHESLVADLRRARSEVQALAFNIREDSPLLTEGSPRLQRIIGVDSRNMIAHPCLRPVHLCHAKVVVIDRKVAYVGGVDASSSKPGGLRDLMLRTEDPVVIAQLAGEMAWLF